MPGKTVYLSLGSNLGDRLLNLRHALEAIACSRLSIVAQSSIYETEPQDYAAQPWFLNMVVQCRTIQFPLQLLSTLQSVERSLGRERGVHLERKGPRIIDIDILLYGRTVMQAPRLTIPHPRMLERRFVLEPLMQLNQELRHPVTGERLIRALSRVQTQRLRVFSDEVFGSFISPQ
jgi:2-amino-4-hydroxy-6-hydroxymethyldihydropteridine diphosphokinase